MKCKLKEQTVKKECIETLKRKLPKDEIQDVKAEWKGFKGYFIEAAEKRM